MHPRDPGSSNCEPELTYNKTIVDWKEFCTRAGEQCHHRTAGQTEIILQGTADPSSRWTSAISWADALVNYAYK